jgi:AraC-like DNA-binding protein
VKTENNWVLTLLSAVGADVQLLQNLHPIEFASLAVDPANVAMEPALVIFNAAAEQIGDNDMGLHMAEHLDLGNLGVYGYLLRNAQTLGEFLDFAGRYYNILFQQSQVSFRRLEAVSCVKYRLLTPTTQPQRQDIDWGIGTHVCFIRQRVGAWWSPNSVKLSYPRPDDITELQRLFGDNIEFSQKTNGFELDNELLEFQISDSDPELKKVIKSHADQLMADIAVNDNLYHRVRLLTMQGIAETGFNADHLASRMGMSPSTLRRRLSEYHLSFRLIREEIIEAIAKQSLAHTRTPISSISLELGYSEPAAFVHAFKRIAGMTPSEYRKQNREG